MQNTAEDISHEATGHKANLSNPNTSQESKENSKQRLQELGGEDAFYGKTGEGAASEGGNPNNIAGGLKAAINNDNNTEEGKQEAQRKLDAME
ncbi:hypothetical protein BT93_L4201 [Corymbia citriodora subsp. variegata]|uniref:Conidiation-specific protein 6 n=1 Tax=Corymbia citriodora subsp. variegata TaxID=360336 RepID=A0A8T0CG50_CORYI|nr:hypothetical protein BT93_L4201 [Corymbia citriodora subsp. variegata]